jgi:hypothetical protein
MQELEQITVLMLTFGTAVWYSCTLSWSLRHGKIPMFALFWREFGNIEKRTSPWNYRVAVAGQAFLAVGMFLAFVVELKKLLR